MTRTRTGPDASDVFHAPVSVAVVGASDNPAKWGYWLARGALSGADRRRVHLVNHGGGRILGTPAATRLDELPEVPELVAICVPGPAVPGVVDQALALGVRGLLVITAEVPDPAGLAARARSAGARLLGPTSLGLYDAETQLHLAWGDFAPGGLAIVSQSGQIGSEIALLAQRAGLGVSRFVSVGAQADLTTPEVLRDLARHQRTRAVAVYAEGFADGPRLFAAMRELRAAGKPVVLLGVGGSEAGRRAALSHTGALTPPLEAVDAACRAAGAVRVRTPAELVDLAGYLLATPVLPGGPRLAIVSDSGGQAAIAADCASRAGLVVPALSGAAAAAVAAQLPGGVACGNPVDLAGAGERDLATYHRVVAALLDSGEADAVLLSGYFGRYAVDSPALAGAEAAVARELAAQARRTGTPLLVHSMAADGPTAALLREQGVPVLPTVEAATRTLAHAWGLARDPGREPPRLPVADRDIPAHHLTARELLTDAGIGFPPGSTVTTAAEAVAAARELRAPYVLKAAWLAHKTEQGGVRVGLGDPDAVREAFARMRGRLGAGPYLLEEQDVRAGVVEVIVGARRDPQLGPLVLVGAGGTEAELSRDVVVECAPVTVAEASAMLRRLRCAPLLDGWRGRPATDVAGLAEAVAAVSRLIVRLPGLAELEINPLRVGPDGVVAVDALAVPAATSP